MRVAVAGSTGTVGTLTAQELERRGHEVVALSRSTGVDLMDGSGLAGRLMGVDVVVDCLGPATTREKVAVDVFTTTTRHLLEAERTAGVERHVVLSIVGIDLAPHGYYLGKIRQEEVARASDRRVTIVRATQFHEFAEQMLTRARLGPLQLAPRLLSAPVSAAEVAAALADVVEREPDEQTVEVTGPEELSMVDMVRAVARARGRRGPVLGFPMPGGPAVREGALLSRSPWRVGTQTFAQWLDQRA